MKNLTAHLQQLKWSLLFFIPFVSVSCSSTDEKGTFVISSPQNTAEIVVQSNEKEFVHTAVDLFANDVLMVTDRKPEIKTSSDSPYQIKIGTIGLNPDFDRECVASGIDIESLIGKWEAYIIKAIQKDSKHILYVIGSQSRGTAYGLMELSQRIGVSPWYWWDDIHPQKQETLIVPGDLSLQDGPKVQFRGIFINDEDWGLQPWAVKTFEPETGDIGPKTYAKVFELLLRLKANAIWPAMHPCTRAFFTYPGDIKMADKYGIFIGSSHAEPMLRNNVDEWHRWEPAEGKREDWNFDTNPAQLKEYWRERVDSTLNHDVIYTIGMRGVHDSGMPGGKTLEDKVQILDQVFDVQRKILQEESGRQDASQIPQIFCPYKEVLKLYRMGAKVPDYAAIMWADDNNGYIRQLSDSAERQRSGGAGVYYHISYWGRPHDYLWIESTPASLIWEEMHKAYKTNAKRVWIVNVGDIKANEIGMNFFLNTAWNPDQYSSDNLGSWYNYFAEIQFGAAYADEIGDLLKQYFQLGFSRKPEHMGWSKVYPNTTIQDPALSLVNNGDEVQQRIDAYDKLEKQAEAIYQKLPDRLKDAFFELVAYKVIGASNMNKKLLYAYKSREYAKQGRVIANQYADEAKQAFEMIKAETERYNEQIASGKWNHIISWQPRKLPVFDMPETGHVDPQQKMAGGVVPEGDSEPMNLNTTTASLPVFNKYTDRRYFVDVFNAGCEPLNWKAVVDQPWVKLSEKSGQTATQNRIWVSMNWDKVSTNDTVQATVSVELNGQTYPIQIKAIKPDWPVTGKNQFVEDNGVISIEAEHFSEESRRGNVSWKLIQGLGRTGDAMGTFPVTAPPFNTDDLSDAPSLSYDFYSTTSGDATLLFYCLPSQPIDADYQLRFAVSVDGEKPVIVNAILEETMDENNPEWQKNVLRAVTVPECQMDIPGTGKRKLKITMIDSGVVLDKIVIDQGGLKSSYFGPEETKTN